MNLLAPVMHRASVPTIEDFVLPKARPSQARSCQTTQGKHASGGEARSEKGTCKLAYKQQHTTCLLSNSMVVQGGLVRETGEAGEAIAVLV
jgi:hypothetical protein